MPNGSLSGRYLIGSGESAIVVLDLTTGTMRYSLLLLLLMEPLSIYLSEFTLPGVGVDILWLISWRSWEGSLTFTGSEVCFSISFLTDSFAVVVVVDG